MTRVIFASVWIGWVASFAAAQSTHQLILQMLDEPTKISLQNIKLGEAIAQLTEQTGVTIVMPRTAMRLVPHGPDTFIREVILENLPLREALHRLFDPLGMSFVVQDDHVEIVPKPALQDLGRPPHWDELDTLYQLSNSEPGVNAHVRNTLQAILQFKVPIRNGWPLLSEALIHVGAGKGDEVLTVACRNLRWSWSLAGKKIIVTPMQEKIRKLLERPISLRMRNRTLHDIMQAVADAAGVPIATEPGVLASLPMEIQRNFSLTAQNQPAEQVLDSIAAYTGLGYVIEPESVLFYDPSSAALHQVSPATTPRRLRMIRLWRESLFLWRMAKRQNGSSAHRNSRPICDQEGMLIFGLSSIRFDPTRNHRHPSSIESTRPEDLVGPIVLLFKSPNQRFLSSRQTVGNSSVHSNHFALGLVSHRNHWERRSPLLSGSLNKGMGLGSLVLLSLCCTRIDVAPTCPANLSVGQEGTVSANPTTPGAVPTFTWEVIPASAGEFGDSTAQRTTFLALEDGEALIQMTASDSLFVATGQCRVQIGAGTESVRVALAVDPVQPEVDAQARLICSSTGSTAAQSFEIEQTAGPTVQLTPSTDGIFLFTPGAAGEVGFQCVGVSANGITSEPAQLFVIAIAPAPDNTGRPPSRGGR